MDRNQEIVLKRYICLSILDDHSLLLSKLNRVYIYDLNTKTVNPLFIFSYGIKDIIAQLSPWLRRLFRVDTRYGLKINHNSILFVRNRMIYEYGILQKSILSKITLPRGSRPLNITLVKSLITFEYLT